MAEQLRGQRFPGMPEDEVSLWIHEQPENYEGSTGPRLPPLVRFNRVLDGLHRSSVFFDRVLDGAGGSG